MKLDKLLLLAAGAAAVVLAFVPGLEGGLLGALALPFTALGWLLRTLSLSGIVGNIAALVLYGLICCIPLVFWWRGRRRTEDWLLVLLSGVLALVLYYMVNPNLRQGVWQGEMGDVVYSFPVWSTLVAWGVLKLVMTGEVLERNIYRSLRIFLLLGAAGCLMDALGTELKNLLWYLNYYSTAQYAYTPGQGATVSILFLRYMARAAEGLLTALVLCKGTVLLDALEADSFSAACVEAAEQVSRRCRSALAIITLSSLALNLGQLLIHELLMNVQMELVLPVMGMAVCFVMLAVTKLLVRGKALKDETDLFI